MDLLLKHLGKHEISEIVDDIATNTLGHHTLGVKVLLEVHINLMTLQMVCMTI